MSYGTIVLLLGAIVMGAAVLTPMLGSGGNADDRRRMRRRGGWAAACAFGGLALLHAYADRLDHPPAPTPPPIATGRDIEAEMIVPTPPASGLRASPLGVRVEPSGYGTILAAPPTPGGPDPMSDAAPPAPAVAPGVAHLIRVLPRVRNRPRPRGDGRVVLDLAMPPLVTGTLILRNGCFRLSGGDEPLALLPAYAQASLDDAGYLILGPSRAPRGMTGRVGETMWWDGPTMRVTNAAVTGPLRQACGPGRVVRVGTGSAALRRREGDENAARSLSNRYGMSIAQARGEVAACQADADRRRTALERRFGANPAAWPNDLAPGPCTPSPPRVVTDASACPPRTTLRGGLCLTERGLMLRDRSRPLL